MSSMIEDLKNYKLQLQQVEAALLTDSKNEELLKLKADLGEVIELTNDLIKSQEGDPKVSQHSSSNVDDFAAPLGAEDDEETTTTSFPVWQRGEKCLAKWKLDGVFYEAVIEEIDSTCVKVKFEGYTTLETVPISEIKRINASNKRQHPGDDKSGKGYNKEYLKKKKQKKQQRFKQIEEERETEKNKWLSFHSKSSKKPGVKTKSIFASPESLAGRVGIGTCGMSGRPMTEFTHGEKWKKGG